MSDGSAAPAGSGTDARSKLRALLRDLEERGELWHRLQWWARQQRAAAWEAERAELASVDAPSSDFALQSDTRADGALSPRVLCITDPAEDAPPDDAEERRAIFLPVDTWLGRVERASEGWRRSRARDLRRQGGEGLGASLRDFMDSLPDHELATVLDEGGEVNWLHAVLLRAHKARQRVIWYSGRAAGQEERFARIDECGDHVVRIQCDADRGCGSVREVPHRCSVGKLCVSCRAQQANDRRQRFAIARRRALQDCARKGFMRRRRKGGRWTEKFITLTVPHVGPDRWIEESEGPRSETARRIRLIFDAWRKFSVKWRKWLRTLKNQGHPVSWYRAFEWTPGESDDGGHPHFHLWALTPFLDRDMLTRWWRAALQAVDPSIDWVIKVDVREIRTRGEDFRRELIKPSAVRVVGQGGEDVQRYIEGWTLTGDEEIDPEVAARVLAATDRRRLVQATRGFLDPAEESICPDCLESGTCTIRIVYAEDSPRAHGLKSRPSDP